MVTPPGLATLLMRYNFTSKLPRTGEDKIQLRTIVPLPDQTVAYAQRLAATGGICRPAESNRSG